MEKRRAILSVYHKTGIVEFARQLEKLDFQIISSGGTAKELRANGVSVTEVTEITCFPEILDDRVKTLHPKVHGGLLAKKTAEHRQELKKHEIPWYDLLCVDLYPLEAEIAKPNCTPESVLKETDIGGPAMLRSAAKGRRVVICDPADRERVLDALKNGDEFPEELLNELAAKAEFVVSKYCLASAGYHSHGTMTGFTGRQVRQLKYGENPWQTPASLYCGGTDDPLAIDRFACLEGDPSFITMADFDRLLQTVTHIAAGFDLNFGFVPLIAVGDKHGNPCGAAVGDNRSEVLQNMLTGDPLAIFGGVMMVNFEIGVAEAEILLHEGTDQKRLIDGIAAPAFSPVAIDMLKRKNGKCKLFANQALASLSRDSLDVGPRFRQVRGGFLKQPNYTHILDLQKLGGHRITGVGEQQHRDLVLAWAIGSTSNSNTIAIVVNGQLLGNGVGQQDRVGAAQLAVDRAKRSGHIMRDDGVEIWPVAYSDSFFPFPDGAMVLADADVMVILASSGSVKDKEVLTACAERNVHLYLIPDAEGRGFFGH